MNEWTKDRDKKMISNPLDWPSWPFLPIKRWQENASQLETALIYVKDPLRVVTGNLFHLPKDYEKFRELPAVEYDTIDAILADGWVVD